jgi:CubicO group peptidase (beta-lactamase class C family)
MTKPLHVPLLTILCSIATLAPTFAHSKDFVIEKGPTGQQIVKLVRDAHASLGFSGAVLAAEKGEIIAAVAVGESQGKPHEVTTLFELASCTKPFTAVAVMKLVEDGKLALDDPIAKYLPGIPEDCRDITVRHLLQHTSGIPRNNSQGGGTDLAAVIPTFLAGGPQSPPGEKHEYWNQGYALLSEVIAQAGGKPYAAYCRTAIFKPCKMLHSCFNGDKPPKGATVSIGASERGDRSALEHPYGAYGFQYRGMGGLCTNLVDLWKWDRALAAGKLLKPASIAEMTRPGPGDYALGWRITQLDNGHTVHEHTGSVRGFLASIRRDPAADGCLFVLAASDASLPFDIVKSSCELALAGKTPSFKPPKALDDKQIDELVGEYKDDKGRTATVSREGGLTRCWIDWFGPITRGYLGAQQADKLGLFLFYPGNQPQFKKDGDVAIERDPQGAVTGLTLLELKPPLTFTRQPN